MSELLKAFARLLHLPVSPLPPPPKLGVEKGRLLPCPGTANCVSSQSTDNTRAMEPIRAAPDRTQSMLRLRQVLAKMPRARIVELRADYQRAGFRTRIVGFVDDVGFVWSEDESVIHFRSASRVGRWDLGVNRRRMSKIKFMMEVGYQILLR